MVVCVHFVPVCSSCKPITSSDLFLSHPSVTSTCSRLLFSFSSTALSTHITCDHSVCCSAVWLLSFPLLCYCELWLSESCKRGKTAGMFCFLESMQYFLFAALVFSHSLESPLFLCRQWLYLPPTLTLESLPRMFLPRDTVSTKQSTILTYFIRAGTLLIPNCETVM